jgi:hypothetical protein
MSLKSAHGGSVQIGTGSITVVPVGRWNGNWRYRDAEVTQSDSGGSTLYLGVVQDNEYEFSLCRDDTNYPEALGLSQGSVIAVLWFKLGSGTKADKLVNSLITEVSPVVDNTNDVVRVNIRGKGGLLTPNQTIA